MKITTNITYSGEVFSTMKVYSDFSKALSGITLKLTLEESKELYDRLTTTTLRELKSPTLDRLALLLLEVHDLDLGVCGNSHPKPEDNEFQEEVELVRREQ
jgi:hypothetical protein